MIKNASSKNSILINSQIAIWKALTSCFPEYNHINKSIKLLSIIKKRDKYRLKNQNKLNISIPPVCIFSLTWRCNLNCKGCYAKNYSHKEDLKIDEIRRIIKEACELGTYMFIVVGGEPLMVPGIMEILHEQKEGFFLLFTNGTLLNLEYARKLKKAENIFPIISVEGEALLSDYRRGSGVGKKIEDAMNILHDFKIPFGFATVATHRNLKDITSRKWLKSLWDLGARFGFIIDYIPFPKDLDESLMLTDEDRLFKKEELKKCRAESKAVLFNFPPDEYYEGNCQGAGRGFIHINADGYVEPCPFSHYAADNVKDKSLEEILKSNFLKKLRDQFYNMSNPKGECLLFANSKQVESIANETGAFNTES